MKIHLNHSEVPDHPLLPTLTQVFQESGLTCTEEPSTVELILGAAGQGFSQLSISKIEAQIHERFLGAELFLQARAFPFARIRCGLDADGVLIIASPIEDGLIYRLAKLLQQYKQIDPQKDEKSSDPIGFRAVDLDFETSTPSLDTSLGHWENELFALGLTSSNRYPAITEYSSYPAVHHLLQSTTARRIFTDEKDQEFAVFGFPDLLRPSSKILLFSRDGGIIALHRRQQTVIISPKINTLITLEKQFEDESIQEDSSLLGFGDGLVYFEKNDIVYSWKGDSRLLKLGKKASVIASLCLQWSSR